MQDENPKPQIPSIGRIVHYTLSERDALKVNRRRTTGSSIAERIKQEIVTLDHGTVPQWPLGAQAHIGNDVKAGDVFPMTIVRVWGSTPTSAVNGQVQLDGNDTFWVTFRSLGEGPGTWIWPPRT